ncbi:MAG: transposase [Meiothermus sp.]|nr:MAG: transposase [Meiothermus sp.]
MALLKLLGGLSKGYLVLDDVVIVRWQRGRLDLPKIKDSSTNRYVRGFGVVVLRWTNGSIRLPLAFRVCWGDEGKEGSKQVMAMELLLWAVEQGFKPEFVLFDAWYASKELLRKIHELGWSFVTRLRKNRLLDGRQLRHHESPFWVKEGKLKGIGFLVKVLRRGNFYLCTNAVKLSRHQMLETYAIRSNIEEAVRGLQQELGWQGHRHHKRDKLTAHLALGFLCYALIEFHRTRMKQPVTFYQYRRKLISGAITPDLSPLAQLAG